jgi:rod shape-determining protein MreC
LTSALHRRTSYLFLAISVGHILLISAQVQSKSGLPVLQMVAFGSFAKVQQSLAAVTDGARSLWTNYFALRGVARENEALKRRNLELEGQLQQLQALAANVHALEDALTLQKSTAQATLAARVIAGDPSPGSLTITIDRGADDGVQPDMAVIGPRGVVGRVINRPLPHVAQVQLLIGRNAGAAVTFPRSGAGGFAKGGSGDPPLSVEFVPNSADLKVGDIAVTSGQDRLYPPGLVVGTVEFAERHAGVWTVKLRPSVDFSHVDVVLIVLDRVVKPPAGGGGA